MHNLNPYPGPRPFSTSESNLFAGRNCEILELSSLIVAHPAVLLYAQSGAGKTSLLNAGLVPALRRKHVSVLPVCRVGLPMRPAVEVHGNIYTYSAVRSLLPKRSDESLLNASFSDALREARRESHEAADTVDLLVLDQFEELFSYYPERWRERREFVEQIRNALAEDDALRVLLLLREDYLAPFIEVAHLLPEQVRTKYHLPRLREPEALLAVVQPLASTPWSFEPGVAEKLVKDLLEIRVETALGTGPGSGEFVEPVQLQIVCSSLLNRLPEGQTRISFNDLHIAPPDRALGDFYDSAVQNATRTGVPEADVRSWFATHLITPAGTRGLVFRDAERTADLPNTALDALEAQHIVRAEVRSGSRWYELTHDRFIQPIQTSNQRWNEKFRMVRTALDKGADFRLAPAQTAKQFAEQARVAAAVQVLTPTDNHKTVLEHMNALAVDYERVRAGSPPSNERTHAMNEVVGQMRALGKVCAGFWDGFANSESSGRRLAAAVIAQVDPGPRYVDWLRDRFGRETTGFVAYQCALALLRIAEAADADEVAAVKAAAKDALAQLGSLLPETKPDDWVVKTLNMIVQGRYSRQFAVSGRD